MKLHWPWRRAQAHDRLALRADAESVVYAHADAAGRLKRCGVAQRGQDSAQEFGRLLRSLGLPERGACAVLPLADGQLLQVEAPAVRPEEMKAAARWKVKDLVNGRVDEMTLDVMFVGDDRPRAARQLFVAAARNDTIRAAVEHSQACGLEVAVVDLTETAQRNLQSALAKAEGLGERACAALVRHGALCLLTICAGGELFYARRLDWEDTVVAAQAPPTPAPLDLEQLHGADFIDYGADTADSSVGQTEASRLVIEIQRSLDLWERSWPDLPLAAVWVQVGAGSAELALLLQAALGQRVGVLDAERVFPGFGAAAGSSVAREAVFPMLGALLRHEARKL